MFSKLDHIAIAVRSIDERLAFYRGLGFELLHREEVVSEGVEIAYLAGAGSKLELLAPLLGGGVLERFLERRGEGLHHLCYLVSDLEEVLGVLEGRGIRCLSPRIRRGAGGVRVSFLHPKDMGGVLLELKEELGGGLGS